MFPYKNTNEDAGNFSYADTDRPFIDKMKGAWRAYGYDTMTPSMIRDWDFKNLGARLDEPFLSQDEARQFIRDSGLPMSEWNLSKIKDNQYTRTSLNVFMREQQTRNALYSAMGNNNGKLESVALFGVGLISSMRDPAEFALNLVPVSRLSSVGRAASMAARQSPSLARRAVQRFAAGATDGGITSAAIEPFYAGMHSKNPFEQYGFQDSFLNVTMGTFMGGGIHAVGGFAKDMNFMGIRDAVRAKIKGEEVGTPVKPAPEWLKPKEGERYSISRAADLVHTHDAVKNLFLSDAPAAQAAAKEIAEAMPFIYRLDEGQQVAVMKDVGEAIRYSEEMRQALADGVELPESHLRPEVVELAEKFGVSGEENGIYRGIESYADAMLDMQKPDAPASLHDAFVNRLENAKTRTPPAADTFKAMDYNAQWESLRAGVLQWAQDKNLNIDPIVDYAQTGDVKRLVEEAKKQGDIDNYIGYNNDAALDAQRPLDFKGETPQERLKETQQFYEDAKGIYEDTERAFRNEIMYSQAEGVDVDRLLSLGDIDEETARMYRSGELQQPSTASDVIDIAKLHFGDDAQKLIDSGLLNIVDSVEQFPYGEHPTNTKAMTLPDGRVFIAANAIAAHEVKGIVLHEVGVHSGLKPMIGNRGYAGIMRSIDNAIIRGDDWARKARSAIPSDTPDIHVKEELLAYAVEHHPELSISQKIISAAKTWFVKNFGDIQGRIKLNDADFTYLALSALKKAARDRRLGGADGVMYSSGEGADTRPFQERIEDGYKDIQAADDVSKKLIELSKVDTSSERILHDLKESFKDIPEEQLKDISDQLERRIAELKQQNADRVSTEASSIFDMQEMAAQEIGNELKAAAYQEQRVRYINEAKELENKAFLQQFMKPLFADDPSWFGRQLEKLGRKDKGEMLQEEAFASMIIGSNLRREGGKLSIDASAKSLRNLLLSRLESDLIRRGVWDTFKNKDNELGIYEAIHALSREEPTTRFSKEVVEVAQSIMSLTEHIRKLKNEAGAWVGKVEGYVVPQKHNPHVMMKEGFEAWKKFVLERLDIGRTFADRGVVDFNKSLRSIYDGLVTGDHESGADKALSTAYKGGRSVAKKASQSRVLHFKDGRAQFEYSQKFGFDDLGYSILEHVDTATKELSLMRKLGTNPENMLLKLMDDYQDTIRGEPRKFRRFQSSRQAIMNMLRTVDGSIDRPANEVWARHAANIRAWQSMSHLGGAGLSSLSDVGMMASEIKAFTGKSYLESVGIAIKEMGRTLSPDEKKILMNELSYSDQSVFGQFAARFDAPDLAPGMLSKGMHAFFKLNILTPWTENMRRAHVMWQSSILAQYSKKSFADLPDQTRAILEGYNIDAKKWNVLKHAVLPAVDGREFMGVEAIRSIPDSVFKKYLSESKRDVNPTTISKARGDLRSDLHAMLIDRMNVAVIEPNAKTRYTMLRGSQRGTAMGEMARFATQFKSWPVAMLQAVYGRDIYGKGYDTLGDAMRHGKMDVMPQIAQLIVLSAAFGYIAMTAKDFFKGREARPLDKPSTWVSAFVQGGGFGIYGDFLFGEFNRYGGGLTSTLAGPTLGSADQVANLWARMRDGDKLAGATFKTALDNTPYMNLFYVRPLMNYLILNRIQEALNPGYFRRMRQNARNNNGQEIQEWAQAQFGG